MKALPLDIGPIHFVGIGGIGMSGIAEILHNLGHAVRGSDVAESANVARLRALGVPIAIGHAARNVGDAKVVVVSSAVGRDNAEVQEARRHQVPVVPRADMLAELMRLKWSIAVGGTHGKTTTTSMVAALLDAADLNSTVINGGIINAYGTNARLGTGEWMVVEADESDGSFVRLPATIALVTNIDPEHLEFYGTFEKVIEAFQRFVENIPFYGFGALCIDHAEVRRLIARIPERRLVTYGLSKDADVRGVDIAIDPEGARFSVLIREPGGGAHTRLDDLRLPMPGTHNVQNAVGAVAVAHEMGLGADAIRAGLAGFAGVKRRFTKTGEARGITVIDDYGHHPVEIAAVLDTARAVTRGRVIAVVQPHRYSRLRDLFGQFTTCFARADIVIVAPVYPAGEPPIPGIDRDALIAGIRGHGHSQVFAIADASELAPLIRAQARTGDLVVCLGAGSITTWAQALPNELLAAKVAS